MLKTKARIVPLYFKDGDKKEFQRILGALKEIYEKEAEFLPAREAGEKIGEEADAVLFPVLDQCLYGNRQAYGNHTGSGSGADHCCGGIPDV